jgi:hypothetical protein
MEKSHKTKKDVMRAALPKDYTNIFIPLIRSAPTVLELSKLLTIPNIAFHALQAKLPLIQLVKNVPELS